MNLADEVAYRAALAAGFLAEAEQDFGLTRWRSCVNNAQLAVENAGKSVMALFDVTRKTHDSAKEVAAILRNQDFPSDVEEKLKTLLPSLLALGSLEHFLTDYGDEATYTLPWDLFDENSASEALKAARASVVGVKELMELVGRWRDSREDPAD